jgi:hypothetical protein
MREWMRDRGYQDRPLIITEYGILMPEIYGYDYQRVQDFMLGTFDWLTTATDPDIGYPADGNRLVQAWAWYSLNEPAFEGFASWNHLFYPDTRSPTPLGMDFSAYTAPLTQPFPGAIDLLPIAVWHTDPAPGGAGSTTMTVVTSIHNGGASTAHNVLVRFERDGLPAGEATIASIAPSETKTASITWESLVRGSLHQVTIAVNPDGQIVECDPFNNRLSTHMLVTDIQTYLPMILKNL